MFVSWFVPVFFACNLPPPLHSTDRHWRVFSQLPCTFVVLPCFFIYLTCHCIGRAAGVFALGRAVSHSSEAFVHHTPISLLIPALSLPACVRAVTPLLRWPLAALALVGRSGAGAAGSWQRCGMRGGEWHGERAASLCRRFASSFCVTTGRGFQ